MALIHVKYRPISPWITHDMQQSPINKHLRSKAETKRLTVIKNLKQKNKNEQVSIFGCMKYIHSF